VTERFVLIPRNNDLSGEKTSPKRDKSMKTAILIQMDGCAQEERPVGFFSGFSPTHDFGSGTTPGMCAGVWIWQLPRIRLIGKLESLPHTQGDRTSFSATAIMCS
jgi:hypothetical protein